jgi:hypothetical protein
MHLDDDNLDYDFDAQIRVKRAVPLLALAALAAGTTGGGMVGFAIKQALGSPFSNGQSQAETELMVRFAKEIKELKIDSQQQAAVTNNLVKRLQYFETQIIGNFGGITAITMGLDLKALCQQLQTVTQLTLLKYNSALLAAATGKTSPYVLTQDELDGIVKDAQRGGINLSPDLSTIKTTPVLNDNKITFIFDIPIIDSNKEFSIFTITALPMFMDNGTYLPTIDSNHVAINNHGDKFTTLTDLQLAACLDKPPRCSSNTAITPIRSAISCVALTYQTDTQECPLSKSTIAPLARFYFFEEMMFYSTPNPEKLFILCTPSSERNTQPEATLRISGFGQYNLTPGCTLTLPDGNTHHTPSKPIDQTLYDKPLFKQITIANQPLLNSVKIDNSRIFDYQPSVHLTESNDEEDIVDFTDRMTKSFHPATVAANTTQTLVIILSLAAVACLIYFCCRAPLGCTCCKRQARLVANQRIPEFHDPPREGFWFREPDPEPDTISAIAARQGSRLASFATAPFQNLPASFPKWTKHTPVPTNEPPPMSTTQMTAAQVRAMEAILNIPPPALPVSGQPQSILKKTTGTIPKTRTTTSQLDYDKLTLEQQQMMPDKDKVDLDLNNYTINYKQHPQE